MKTIMDEASMQRAITRIAYEILERNRGAEQLAIIGIYLEALFWPIGLQNELLYWNTGRLH